MSSIWVARDGNNWLTLFFAEPSYDEDEKWWYLDGEFTEALDSHSFPEILPGECREFRAVESEVKDES